MRHQWSFHVQTMMKWLVGLSKERPILDHHPKAHIHEIWRISGEIHPQPYKIRCFNKNSSVWGGCMEGAMTPDFMKSRVIAPLLHSSNWIVLVETPAFTRFWVDFTWNPADFMWNRKTHLQRIVTLCLSTFPLV